MYELVRKKEHRHKNVWISA